MKQRVQYSSHKLACEQAPSEVGKKIPWAKRAGVIASAHVSNQRCDENFQISLQWTVHCTPKPLLTVSARIMLIYKQLSRSVNYLFQSCQQSSIQPIRSWYQELVSWNGGINGMSTVSPAQTLLTRPLSVHPVRPNCTRLSPTGACSQASMNRFKFLVISRSGCSSHEWKFEQVRSGHKYN